MWYPPAETKIPFSAIIGAFSAQVPDFKGQLCKYLNVKHCILGDSGRGLLFQLLQTLYQKDKFNRNVVLIPGYTCYSVAASVVKAGLKLRVYDLDPKTLQPDLKSLKQGVLNDTLAIVYQHLFGIPASVDEIRKIDNEMNAYLIEDAAQALGGKTNENWLGTTGDFGLYSFGRGKPLPGGSGGALLSISGDILKKMKGIKANNGYGKLSITALSQVVSKPQFYGIAESLPLGLGETKFETDFEPAGMPLMMQKLLTRSLQTLEGLNLHRQRISKIYDTVFNNGGIIPVRRTDTPVYTRYPLISGQGRIPKELRRFGVRRMYPEAIADVKNIRPYIGKHSFPTPGSRHIAKSLITLPTHSGISADLARQIAQKVKERFVN